MTEVAIPLQHPISQDLHDSRTKGERLADAVASQIGSWRFLIIQSFLVAAWVGLNLAGAALRWDPYPFVLLNLLFSVQAAYTGPVLLLSQNRAAQRDRIMAEHDYVTNEKGEKLVEALMNEVLRNSQATLAIAAHLGIEITALADHQADLDKRIEQVKEELSEVEDVLAEQPPPSRRLDRDLTGTQIPDDNTDTGKDAETDADVDTR